MTAAVLAVDAGNSKTDVAIVAADGDVLGSARGPGFLAHIVGADTAVAGLQPLVDRAAAAAGLGASTDLVQHVSACLANADFPSEQRLAVLDARRAGRGGRHPRRHDVD